MPKNEELMQHKNILISQLPKDIIDLMIEKYLTTAEQDILSVCSQDMYKLMSIHRLARLRYLSLRHQTNTLVKLAMHIDKFSVDKETIIQLIRNFSSGHFSQPAIAVLALTCLAKLTNLTISERTIKILALEKTPAVICRSLSAMLMIDNPSLSFLISKEACHKEEFIHLMGSEALLCNHFLGLKSNASPTLTKVENIIFTTNCARNTITLSSVIRTSDIYDDNRGISIHSSYPTKLLTSIEALNALPFFLTQLNNPRFSSIDQTLAILLNQIYPTHADLAWTLLNPHMTISDVLMRHSVIMSSLQLLKHNNRFANKIYSYIRNEIIHKISCISQECTCTDLMIVMLLKYAAPDQLNHVLLDLTALKMEIATNVSWFTIMKYVENSDVAALIIHTMLNSSRADTYNDRFDNQPHRINAQANLIGMLDQTAIIPVLEDILQTFSHSRSGAMIGDMLCEMAKKLDVELAGLAIAYLFNTTILDPSKNDDLLVKIVIELVKRFDTKGDKLILPLLYKILTRDINYKYPAFDRVDSKIILDFLYTNLIDRIDVSNSRTLRLVVNLLTINLNLCQLTNIWSKLINSNNFFESSFYILFRAYVFFELPLNQSTNFREVLNLVFINFHITELTVKQIISNIIKYDSLSEMEAVELLEKIVHTAIQNADLKYSLINNLLEELPSLIKHFNSKEFNNDVINTLLLIIADGDKNRYTLLKRLQRQTTPEIEQQLELAIGNVEHKHISSIMAIFSLLNNAPDFTNFLPLIFLFMERQEIKSRHYGVPDYATITLINSTPLLSAPEIQRLHAAFIMIATPDNRLGLWHIFQESLPHKLSHLFSTLNDEQFITLFNSICANDNFEVQLELIERFIFYSKEKKIVDPAELLLPYKHLQVALGHHFSDQSLVSSLPAPNTLSFENFLTNYINLYDLPRSNENAACRAINMIACIKRFHEALGIDDTTKRIHFCTLINKIFTSKNIPSPELITHLILIQLIINYQLPELSFIFPTPQDANPVVRFKNLLNSIAIGSKDDVLTLEPPSYLDDIAVATQYIQSYCASVTNINHLDELSEILRDMSTNIFAYLFPNNSPRKHSTDHPAISKLSRLGIFKKESTSHAEIGLFKIIEDRKRALENLLPAMQKPYKNKCFKK